MPNEGFLPQTSHTAAIRVQRYRRTSGEPK
jgi:hypothetical protein